MQIIRSPWWTVFALLFVYIFAMIDRQVLSLLIGGIKSDLKLGDFQAGLLLGPAFGIFYVIGGPIFGYMLDRFARKRILAVGVGLWSLANMACGLASSFTHLFLARMLVGAGEASIAPGSYGLIGDSFPRKRFGLAISVFAIGGTLGGGLALVLGGWLLHLFADGVPFIPLLEGLRPWQLVLIATGAPGVVLIAIILAIRDPRPANAAGAKPRVTMRELLPFIRSRRAFLICHFTAFCATGMVAYSLAAWSPEHMARTFGWGRPQIGAYLGIGTMASSIVSHLLSGALVDHLYARGVRDAVFRVFITMQLIALPVMATCYFYSSPYAFVAGYTVLHLLVVPFSGLSATSLQLVTPSAFRSSISGLFMAVLGLVGLSIGPTMVGFVTQYVIGDEARLGLSITLVGSTGMTVAIAMMVIGLRYLRQADDELTRHAPVEAAPAVH